jgi:hypothetical protein
MESQEQVVLYDSPEAASIATVTGWQARTGEFWGNNEHMARWCGSTHKRCDGCGAVIAKSSWCTPCRDAKQREKFAAFQRRPWDGAEPLHLFDTDTYFFSAEVLSDYCQDHGVKPEELALVFCKPNCATPVDPYDIYQDLLGEDLEVPDAIASAFDVLNAAISACREPLSWEPIDVAADPASVASVLEEI